METVIFICVMLIPSHLIGDAPPPDHPMSCQPLTAMPAPLPQEKQPEHQKQHTPRSSPKIDDNGNTTWVVDGAWI